jgi:hypothetical protein
MSCVARVRLVAVGSRHTAGYLERSISEQMARVANTSVFPLLPLEKNGSLIAILLQDDVTFRGAC